MLKDKTKLNIIAIIPARMGSSGFPGKPLADIAGMPMIEHVYHRSRMSSCLTDVFVATCDEEIKKAVEGFGGRAIMTKDTHERASDRATEAMMKIEEESGQKTDIVVMVQGDEPLITPGMIDAAVEPIIKDNTVHVVNLTAPIKTEEEQNDRNEIKVVMDGNNFALYFSREPIPTRVKTEGFVPMFKQICVIPFRREFLLKFNELPQGPLEIAESVDMLRLLENGHRVKMVPTEEETYSVDTPEDLRRVNEVMEKDDLYQQYQLKKGSV